MSNYLFRAALCIGLGAIFAGCPATPKKIAKPTPPTVKKAAPKKPPLPPWSNPKTAIKAPDPSPAGALKLPKIQRFTLKNGLRVMVVRDSSLPLSATKLLLEVGSIDDPADKVGLADFTTQMLRHGVRGKNAEQIAKAIDSAGARLSVSPGYEVSTVGCHGRSASLELCLSTVAAMVSKPTFPKSELAEVRDSLLGEVKQNRDSPGMLAALHFYNQLYGDDHPAGRPITANSVNGIKRKDIRRFHKRVYRPHAAILVLSGDIPQPIEKLVKKNFARWRRGKRPARKVIPVQNPMPGLRVLLIDKPDLSQSSFMIGHAGVALKHPSRDALRIVDYTLGGGGFSSRLMKEVRSRGGKTYGISSAFYAQTFDGLFRVRSETRNKEIVNTLRLVQKELARMLLEPPSATEIAAAKGKIAGGYAIRFNTTSKLASALALSQLRGFSDSYVSELPKRIESLSAETIAAGARKHLHPRNLLCTIVGRAAVVAPLLRAAKIPFEHLSYLDPISAKKRQEARVAVKISPREQKKAAAILAKAQKAAGGLALMRRIKGVKIEGTLKRGPIVSRYVALLLPPDHARLTFQLAMMGGPKMSLKQILTPTGAYMVANGKRKNLPHVQRRALRMALWKQTAFVLRNASDKKVKLRPTRDPTLSKDTKHIAIDVFPPQGRPLTLIFAAKTYRLVGMQYRKQDGSLRSTAFSDHKKVNGLWLPHKQTAGQGKRQQQLIIERIDTKAPISKADISS